MARIIKSRGIKPGTKIGLSPDAQQKAEQAKKLYCSTDPVYSVREIAAMIGRSTKTLYKYLRYKGVQIGDREFL